METVFHALAPVIVLIAMGHVIKRFAWLDDGFWPPAERLTYYVFFPALLVASVSRADLSGEQTPAMAGVLIAAILATAAAAVALKPLLNLGDAQFTSFFQGTIRPNTYIGVVASFLFWGDTGLTLYSIGILVAVPLVNVLSVAVMVVWGDHARDGKRDGGRDASTAFQAVREIARNPLVAACLLGFALNVLDLGLPPVIEPLLDILGRAALPIALLAVGAGLDFPDLMAYRRTASLSTTLKLLILPALAWMLAGAFGLDGVVFQVTILYAAMPASASAYVLAREMGGDAPLMAGIITASTLAAAPAIPAWLLSAM